MGAQAKAVPAGALRWCLHHNFRGLTFVEVDSVRDTFDVTICGHHPSSNQNAQHSRKIGFAATQVRPTLHQIMKSIVGGLPRFVFLSVHALNPGSVVRGSWSARSSLEELNLYSL